MNKKSKPPQNDISADPNPHPRTPLPTDFSSDKLKEIKIWSPYSENISKSDLIKKGYKELGNEIFKTWSCYLSGKVQCGKCESCNNRKIAFAKAKIEDKTKYLK